MIGVIIPGFLEYMMEKILKVQLWYDLSKVRGLIVSIEVEAE